MQPWERIDAIGARQHGAVSHEQIVVEAGVSGRVLTKRVREQGWERPYRGVYLMPGTAPTFQRKASAALLAVGTPARLTGETAAFLDGTTLRPPEPVEIAIPHGRGSRPRPGIRLRRHAAEMLEDSRTIAGLAVASVPVMLLDLARSQDHWSLVRAVAGLCARRATTLLRLDEALERFGPVAGAARLHRVLDDLRGELSHSGTERLLRRHVRALGVRLWPRPYPVVHQERVVAEIDLAAPEVRYGAEVDGPHHLLPQQLAADRARDRLLGRIGWTIDRYGADLVRRNPRAVAREIASRLASLGFVASSEP